MVDACKNNYQGTVNLNKKRVSVGIPNEGASYLNFVFLRSGFLSNSSGSSAFDVYFTPRNGCEYLAEVSYLDGIYDVIIKEKRIGSNQMKELVPKDCRPR